MVLLTIVTFGYGLMGIVAVILGISFELSTYLLFLAFSCGLVLLFLSTALFIGSLSRNRWQALTISVMIWFFLVIGWPAILIAVLSFLPYLWIKPLLTLLTMLNPAELVRLFVVIKLGGGSVLGPEYYEWVSWIREPGGSLAFILVFMAWMICSIACVYWIWERRRSHG
jgi:Cu-processing system permease protein